MYLAILIFFRNFADENKYGKITSRRKKTINF